LNTDQARGERREAGGPDWAIETRGLRREFGSKVAVADLSLSVARGEIFGFLGPNGAGKTTSLKMLLALIEPTSGAGTVLGRPIGDRSARAKIGFLPEHFRFHDCLTGRELLRYHGRLYGLRGLPLEHRIDELLSRVDLLDAAEQPIREYSKGMLQRVGLAQALLNDPVLVFLDEPTSGLDPLGRLLVRDLIRELRVRGTSVFLNSHLLGEVEATCDRVAFVKQGRVIHELSLSASPADLDVELSIDRVDSSVMEGLARFGHGLTVNQTAAPTPTRRETRVGDPGRTAAKPITPVLIRLRVDREESVPELARWLVLRGVNLYGLHGRRKSLEEWFLEVMGEDQRPG
jgi:ABC-2 type transport system ATP-binding protein